MITIRGRIVAGTADVGVVALKGWASVAFSAYILWINCGFKLGRIKSKDNILLIDVINRYSICLTLILGWFAFIISIMV